MAKVQATELIALVDQISERLPGALERGGLDVTPYVVMGPGAKVALSASVEPPTVALSFSYDRTPTEERYRVLHSWTTVAALDAEEPTSAPVVFTDIQLYEHTPKVAAERGLEGTSEAVVGTLHNEAAQFDVLFRGIAQLAIEGGAGRTAAVPSPV